MIDLIGSLPIRIGDSTAARSGLLFSPSSAPSLSLLLPLLLDPPDLSGAAVLPAPAGRGGSTTAPPVGADAVLCSSPAA